MRFGLFVQSLLDVDVLLVKAGVQEMVGLFLPIFRGDFVLFGDFQRLTAFGHELFVRSADSFASFLRELFAVLRRAGIVFLFLARIGDLLTVAFGDRLDFLLAIFGLPGGTSFVIGFRIGDRLTVMFFGGFRAFDRAVLIRKGVSGDGGGISPASVVKILEEAFAFDLVGLHPIGDGGFVSILDFADGVLAFAVLLANDFFHVALEFRFARFFTLFRLLALVLV